MFNVGDKVTIRIPGRYDACTCDYCRVFLAGGYGIINEIDIRDDNNHVCQVQLFDIDGIMTHGNSFHYRFSGLKLLHSNETPDWEI